MGVTFGTTAGKSGGSLATPVSLPSVTVTSGQPIVLCFYDYDAEGDVITGVTDTFSTHYTWTYITSVVVSAYQEAEVWIGTGGAGTSGVITIAYSNGPDDIFACAVPCIGASLAAGLAAVDVYGTTSTLTSPSLTPTASGEGAVYFVGNGSADAITGFPSSPWADAYTSNVETYASCYTYASPTSGVALSTAWTAGTVQKPCGCAVIVKAGAAAAATVRQPRMVSQAAQRSAVWCKRESGLFEPRRRVFVPSLIRAA